MSLKLLSSPVYSRADAQEKDSSMHLSQPLQIIGPSWEGRRKKGSRKGRMHFKACGSGHSGKSRGGGLILLWHFSSLFPLLLLSDEVHRLCVGISRELLVCLCVCLYSSRVLGQWFTRRESSHCGALFPQRAQLLYEHTNSWFLLGSIGSRTLK